jgi:SAM-dependent methyltransferase
VFQHLPDPAVSYGYVREMGRVLRPGGWAAFQVSDDPAVHRARRGAGAAVGHLRAALGRGPRGAAHPAWLGSSIDLPTLREAAAEAGMDLVRCCGEGTQFCLVALRRHGRA